MSSRTLLLLAHLLGTVAFFSNFVAAIFWQRRAAHAREPAVVAYAFRTLNAGDLWITPISVFLLLASGVGLALLGGLPLLATGWILWSTAAFLASGLVFVFGVLPLQRRIARWTTSASAAAGSSEFDWERYDREARRWSTPAHWSLGLALFALIVMVVKPALPAF
jgi:uncharacterized membrane protein